MYCSLDVVLLQGVYLTTVMAMTSISVIMTVFVLNLHYRGAGDLRPLPGWIRHVIGTATLRRGLTLHDKRQYSDIRQMSLHVTVETLANQLGDELQQVSK